MNEIEVKKYLDEKYGNQINEIKDKLNQLIETSKQSYKQRDKVYFIEKYFKSSRNQIKCRQYRSAKKRSDTFFFPTRELASEYYKVSHWEMCSLLSLLIDDVYPKCLEESIMNSFAEVRNINFGNSAKFEIKPNDLFLK